MTYTGTCNLKLLNRTIQFTDAWIHAGAVDPQLSKHLGTHPSSYK